MFSNGELEQGRASFCSDSPRNTPSLCFPFGSLRSPHIALPTETKVESGTSQSKSGTSVNSSESGVRGRAGLGPCRRAWLLLGRVVFSQEFEVASSMKVNERHGTPSQSRSACRGVAVSMRSMASPRKWLLRACVKSPLPCLQGYLAHKKLPPPPRTTVDPWA